MLAKLSRGVGAVLIASVLVFAVPVSSAQALNPGGIGVLVQGAIKAAAPAAAATVLTGSKFIPGIGTAITVGQVLYMTRDTWMPWVKGILGDGGSQAVGGDPAVQYTWFVTVVRDVATVTVNATGTYWVPDSYNSRAQCKDMTSGQITTTPVNMGGNAGFQTIVRTVVQCAAGSEILSLDLQSSDWDHHQAPTLHWGAPFNAQADGTYTVSVDCIKGDGTTATISATTVGTAADPAGGLLTPSCVQAFGPDAHGTKLTLTGGQTGMTPDLLQSIDWGPTDALYPNCAGAGVSCTYVVTYKDTACVAGQVECINWLTRSEVDGNTDYKCKFGPYSLPLSGCAIAERAYEANPVRLTKLNTDGNPNTWDEPRPSWAPAPLPAPVPIPQGAPGGAPLPRPGTDPLPSPIPTPGTPPQTTADCFAGTISWNPVDWVVVPVQCALAWAFVPSDSLTDVSTQAKADFRRVGIADSIAAVTTAVTGVGGTGGGCAGPAINFDVATVHQVVRPFSACTEPMSTVAGYAYAFITVSTVIGGGYTIIGLLAAAFGYNKEPGQYVQGTLF